MTDRANLEERVRRLETLTVGVGSLAILAESKAGYRSLVPFAPGPGKDFLKPLRAELQEIAKEIEEEGNG